MTPEEHCRLRARDRRHRHCTALLFLLPALVFFFGFSLLPSLWSLCLSFETGGLLNAPRFAGLRNWTYLATDPVARAAIGNTLGYMGMAIPAVFAIAMTLALMLKRLHPGGGFLRGALYFPTLAPPVLAALLWTFVIHPDLGIFNSILRWCGWAPVNWLGPATALPTVALLEVWRGTGFWTLFFLAALLSLPQELYDAARVDGAGPAQRFRHLTLPLLRPTLLFAFIMAGIWNFQLFDSVYLLTDGGPHYRTATAVWYVYKYTFEFDRPGVASAMSFLMLLVSLGLAGAQLKLLRGRR